jgi:hypothetical protein
MKKIRIILLSLLGLTVLAACTATIIYGSLFSGWRSGGNGGAFLHDLAMILTYILLAFAVLSAVLLPLFHAFRDLRKGKKILIAVVLIAGIFGLSVLISPAPSTSFYSDHNISLGVARLINGGLITAYLALIGAFVIIVFSEISKKFH